MQCSAWSTGYGPHLAHFAPSAAVQLCAFSALCCSLVHFAPLPLCGLLRLSEMTGERILSSEKLDENNYGVERTQMESVLIYMSL